MSSQIGATAESVFCTWAMRAGLCPSFPVRGLQPTYDCVIDVRGSLLRVQIKCVEYRARGGKRVNLRRRHGNGTYNKKNVDYIAAVDIITGKIWLFPVWYPGECKELGLTKGQHDRCLVQDGWNLPLGFYRTE